MRKEPVEIESVERSWRPEIGDNEHVKEGDG